MPESKEANKDNKPDPEKIQKVVIVNPSSFTKSKVSLKIENPVSLGFQFGLGLICLWLAIVLFIAFLWFIVIGVSGLTLYSLF